MKIIMVRHGQTMANVLNEQGIDYYTGAINNEMTDLTEEGIKQAENLKERKEIQEIQQIYTSDLKRAIDTVKIVKPNTSYIIDTRLRERSLGVFGGKTKEEILASNTYRKYLLEERYGKFRIDFIQKAPEGENYTELSQRVLSFLESLDFQQEKTIGIFSHLHVMRVLLLHLLGIQPPEKCFSLKTRNCESYVVEGNQIGKFKLISHHLEELMY